MASAAGPELSCGKIRAGYGSATLAQSTYLGQNEYAAQAFDRREFDQLEAALDSIASGASEGGIVRNTVKQIVAKRA